MSPEAWLSKAAPVRAGEAAQQRPKLLPWMRKQIQAEDFGIDRGAPADPSLSCEPVSLTGDAVLPALLPQQGLSTHTLRGAGPWMKGSNGLLQRAEAWPPLPLKA